MKIRLALLLTLLFSVASVAPSFAAGERYALVIGNAKYPDAEAPLKEPINDARDIAEELKRDGFNVDIGENLTGEQMRRAFERLYGKIKPGSVALIFFSGFGVQSSRQSYMIPVDAQHGLEAEAVTADGTLVMYSAALSSVVSDNGSDRSLFVKELLKEIRTPDLMAEETLNRTRVGVTRASRQEQVPWISSSLAEDFSFIPSGSGPRPATPPPPGARSTGTVPVSRSGSPQWARPARSPPASRCPAGTTSPTRSSRSRC